MSSSVFTLENIGVDCSQDVSSMLNNVFSTLFAADDIPKDRLISLLHSKDSSCSNEDISSIMNFLDSSEKRFQENVSNADLVDRLLVDGLERSYTIDADNLKKRKMTIPEKYREEHENVEQHEVPLPPIHSSYQINEEVIAKNNLISPAAIFDHVEDLTKAKSLRKSMQEVPTTLTKTTASTKMKQKELKIREPKEQKRIKSAKDQSQIKKIHKKPVTPAGIEISDLNQTYQTTKSEKNSQIGSLLAASQKTDRLLICHPPFDNQGKNPFFITEPKKIDFTSWQVGKVYEQDLEVRNVSDHSRYFRLLPPRGKHFALGLGQYIGKDSSESSLDASSAHVAPGMSAKFTIRFIPDSLKNINDNLTLQCESGNHFNVPIEAKRVSPVLTIPKQLDLGGCLIGQVKTEVFRICNVAGSGRFMITSASHWRSHVQSGKVPKFTTEVISNDGVFRIKPGFLALKTDDMANLVIQIAPQEVKAYKFELAIICDNCNVQYVTCHVRGQNAFIENLSILETVENSLKWNFVEADKNDKIRLEMNPIRPNDPRTAVLRLDNPGEVDLSFIWTKLKLLVQNNVETPNLEVDEDSPIVVIPNSGTLPAKSTCEFDIVFNPETICNFQTLLSLNLIDSEPQQTAFELEMYASATGVDVSLNSCVVSPPKGIVEIGEIYEETVLMTNNDQNVAVDYDWSQVENKHGVCKISPVKGFWFVRVLFLLYGSVSTK